MSEAQYISVRETAQILGVSERKVMDMIERNELQAYKIANQFLRLKRSEVAVLQQAGTVKNETVRYQYTTQERIHDFFYYNDFYLITVIAIAVLVYIVLRA